MVKSKILAVILDKKRNFIFLKIKNNKDQIRKVILNQYLINKFSQYCEDLIDFELNFETIFKFVKLYPYVEIIRINDYNCKFKRKNKKAEIYSIIDIYKK